MNRTFDLGAGMLTLGGLLLLVSLFLPWFDGDSAWSAFESLDVLLAALAVAGIAHGAGRLGDDTRIGLAIAGGALLAVAVQLLDPPPAYSNADLDSGAWLAFVAGALMVAGAAQLVASFSVSVDVRSRERRRRVAAVDRRQPEPVEEEQRTEAMSAVEVPE